MYGSATVWAAHTPLTSVRLARRSHNGGGDDGDSPTAVPPWQCHKLQVLNVAQNALGRLPDAICELRKLRVLWANGNRISSLPESFGVLQCLTHLDLSENKLEVLPE